MLHIDNLKQVNKIVESKDYSKLLNYKEFHLEKLLKVLRNCKDIKIQKHILNNAVDLESSSTYIPRPRPIHMVCNNLYGLEMLKILIENKVDLECENSRKSRPIHSVCTNDNGVEMLILLIENKVDLDCATICKSRPIHLVCYSNNLEMLKILIENKVDLDPKIRTINNKNWIDYIDQDNRIKLIEENIISVRQCGYIIKYLQEEQTVEMCQDAIDHDPDNKQYIREDLKRYFS